jgi:N12 class adenine-specific DNA methylase
MAQFETFEERYKRLTGTSLKGTVKNPVSIGHIGGFEETYKRLTGNEAPPIDITAEIQPPAPEPQRKPATTNWQDIPGNASPDTKRLFTSLLADGAQQNQQPDVNRNVKETGFSPVSSFLNWMYHSAPSDMPISPEDRKTMMQINTSAVREPVVKPTGNPEQLARQRRAQMTINALSATGQAADQGAPLYPNATLAPVRVKDPYAVPSTAEAITNQINQVRNFVGDPALYIQNAIDKPVQYAKTAVSQLAGDVGKGLTLGAVDVNQGKVFGQKVLPNNAEFLQSSGVSPDVAGKELTGFKTSDIIPALQGSAFDWDIHPAEWAAMGPAISSISRGLWGKVSKPVGEYLYKNAPKALKPLIPTVARIVNSGLTGGTVSTTSGMLQGQPLQNAPANFGTGFIFCSAFGLVGESMNIIANAPMAYRANLYKQAVDKMARWAYGEGKFNSYDEAFRAADTVLSQEINSRGGLGNLRPKDLKGFNDAVEAMIKGQKIVPESSVQPEIPVLPSVSSNQPGTPVPEAPIVPPAAPENRVQSQPIVNLQPEVPAVPQQPQGNIIPAPAPSIPEPVSPVVEQNVQQIEEETVPEKEPPVPQMPAVHPGQYQPGENIPAVVPQTPDQNQSMEQPEAPQQRLIMPKNAEELKQAMIDVNQGRVSEEQANALVELVKGVAKYKGISVDQYIQDRISGLEEGGELPEGALASPLNPDVDPNQQVDVVDISNAVPFKKFVSNKEVLAFIQNLAAKDTHLSSADQKAILSILPQKTKHITYSSRKGLKPEEVTLRKGSVLSVMDLMKNAVLIESTPNTKKSVKPDVDYYHNFYVPVMVNGKIHTVRLVAEEQHNVITVNPTDVSLYDVIQSSKKPVPYNRSAPQGSGGVGTPNGFSISIRQMLKDVKDSQGNPFFTQQVDGVVKAAVAFDADNKAIIHAFRSSNVADMAHELAHIFRRDLTEADAKIAAFWSRAKGGEWDKEAEERFAKGFERYLADGKAPNSRLKGIFEKFKEWMLSIYKHLKDAVKLSPEIRDLFDRLVSGNELEKSQLNPAIYQEGDRVTWTGRKGETLTGTVTSADTEVFGKPGIKVNVDQISSPGGVPVKRTEYVPTGLKSLKKIQPGEPTQVDSDKVSKYNVTKVKETEVPSDGNQTENHPGGSGQVREHGTEPLEGKPANDVPGSDAKREADRDGVQRPAERQGRDRSDDRRGSGLPRGEGDSVKHVHSSSGGRGRYSESKRLNANNFRIQSEADMGVTETGKKTRYRQNVAAIKLLKQIEAVGRKATKEEQKALAKYVGWGGIKEVFEYYNRDWQTERQELRELLTPEEFEAADGSKLNAHYTSKVVVDNMYQALQRLGFKGGRVLEPSLGVGNFFGLMPKEMMAASRLTGVELDSITGRIAGQLYQDADVRVQGFEKLNVPDNFYDVAISNVPFGEYPIADSKYKNFITKRIHNYFFAKALDKVRPGGVVMFITSAGTLNAQDAVARSVRSYINERAEFIGAIRFPNTAFKSNSGTEVVTDLIILQKKGEGVKSRPIKWLDVASVQVGSGSVTTNVTINEYFKNHPDMVLGEHSAAGTMYRSDSYTVNPTGNLEKQLAEAIKKLPKGIITKPVHQATEAVKPAELIPVDPTKGDTREGKVFVQEGKVFKVENQKAVPVKLTAQDVDLVKKYLAVESAARTLLRTQMQNVPDAALTRLQKNLNAAYDAFIAKHGILHSRKVNNIFSGDPDFPLLLSLEDYNQKTKQATKAEIFTKRVRRPYEKPTHADTPQEALAISLNEYGRVNVDRISELTGKTPETLVNELAGLVFENPEGGMETSDEYLSGNVREKLLIAEGAAKVDSKYQANVEALKAVQPEDLKPGDINFSLGQPWIPLDDYADFIKHLFGRSSFNVKFQPLTGSWLVEETGNKWQSVAGSVENLSKWGTGRVDALDLIEMALNQKKPTIYDSIYDGNTEKRVINAKETEAAREKLGKIKEEFRKWVVSETDRAQRLTEKYNWEFNNLRLRTFDGSHLQFPGMSPAVEMRPHQKNAIWRYLQGGNCLFAHCVGAGKTFEMVASVMEARRLGILQKPVIVVPKSRLQGTADDALELYPGAKVLVADDKNFSKEKRKQFMAKIATGDYDVIIMSHNNFQTLSLSEATVTEFFQQQLDELEAARLEEADQGKRSKRGFGSNLQKAKKSMKARMERTIEKIKKRQDVGNVSFEELGIDGVLVDEAHLYKNLFYATSQRVAGLGSTDGNDMTFDLLMKIQYLRRLNGGRGVAFATGTPVANSMAELYSLQRYLQPDELRKRNIHNFDMWASVFGQVVTVLEMSPEGGGFRLKDKFAQFINLPELVQMFRSFADVQTATMLNLPVPKLEGGKRKTEIAKPSPELVSYIKDELLPRAEAYRRNPAGAKPEEMLEITRLGRLAALDMRLVRPDLPDNPNSKVNRAVNNIFAIWQKTGKDRLTQVVFLDLSTPKREREESGQSEEAEGEGRFNISVYQDIKDKLIAKGVPAKEIVFIHDAKTDAQKQQLFDRVNTGEIRIILGSTNKMGVGVNVQKKLVALHHLDCPWRPVDIEQREGRILRQGNENPQVNIFNYVTEGSFDAFMWDKVQQKAQFIQQIMSGKLNSRNTEDVGDMVMNASEIAACASGNPLHRERATLNARFRQLDMLRSSHQNEQYNLRVNQGTIPAKITKLQETVASIEQDIRNRHDITGDKFVAKIGKKTFRERAEADAALKEALNTQGEGIIGTIAGFDLMKVPVTVRGKESGVLYDVTVNGEHIYYPKTMSIQGIEYQIRNMEEILNAVKERLSETKRKQAAIDAEMDKPFEHEEEYRKISKRLKEIDDELNLDKQAEQDVIADSGATDQSKGALVEADEAIEKRISESGARIRQGSSDSTAIAAKSFEWARRLKNALDALSGDDSGKVAVSDAEVEKVLSATKSPLNLRQQVKTAAHGVATGFKDVFEYEWTVKEFPQFQDELRRFKGVAKDAQKFALDKLLKITAFLENPRDYEIFRRLVFLRDLEAGLREKEAEAFAAAKRMGYDKEEAADFVDQVSDNFTTTGGLTIRQIQKAMAELWKQAGEQSSDRIKNALWAHDKTFEALWEDLQERGKVPENAKHREHYVPHRVLDYMQEVDKRFPALSRRFKTPYRYYLNKRTGSARLIDTDYTALTLKHFAKLYMDNAYDDFNLDIAARYDEYAKMTKEQRADVGKLIPNRLYEVDGKQYHAWQYDPGRNYYLQESISEETVMDILQSVLDAEVKEEDRQKLYEAALSQATSDSKTFLAVGRHKRIYLLPVEIADRLTNFKSPDFNGKVLNAFRAFHHFYKMVLFSPVTLGIPFHVNNAFGDAINLIRDDPKAMSFLWDAWKAAGEWQSGEVSEQFKTVVEMAEKYRVAESGLMKNAGMPFHPQLKKLQPKRYALRRLNPFTKWNDLAERRELTPRFAKLMADIERINHGEMPVARYVDVARLVKAGMNVQEVAGKLAREVTVDYDKLTPEGKGFFRDIAMPFFTFYVENFGNWFKYVKRNPGNFAAKFMVPLLAMILWNWLRFPDEEDKLPPYYRVMPHIITGFKDKDGKMIIWSMQTPVEMAARIAGLDTFPDLVRQVVSKKKNAGEAAVELAKNVALGPWETAKDLLTPLFKAPIEAYANKSMFNGRPIVPKQLQGTKAETAARWKYIIGQWFAPVGNWARNTKDDDGLRKNIGDYLTRGPVDIGRAIGIRHVDAGREQINRFYDRLEGLEGDYKLWKNKQDEGAKRLPFKSYSEMINLQKYSKQFSKLWKQVKLIENSKMPKEQREKLSNNLVSMMAKMAESVLKTGQK